MYSFANLCRFCKKSDNHFVDITSKMFREIRQFYNILSEKTDVELNMCLQQVCQTCFKILTNISDILSKCNTTDNSVFRKYLAILKINDKSCSNYECVIKDQVTPYTEVNQCHNTIKKVFVKNLNSPSTSNKYNENTIKTEVADEYNDLNNLEDINPMDIIKFTPKLCSFCEKSDKHFFNVTSKIFREIGQFYKILSENMEVDLNTSLQQVCQTCFQILTYISDILSECNITDTVFRKYLAILKNKDKSYAKCECVIIDEVIHLKGPSTSNEYNENTIKTGIIKTEVVDEYNDKVHLDLNHLEERNARDVVAEIKFIPKQDIEHVYLECSDHGTLFDENNYNHQDDGGHKEDNQNEKFNNKTKLNRHVHSSTGKRPECEKCMPTNKRCFKCDVCNKKFTQRGNLNAHKRIHTGERPFECDVCNKKFTRKIDLNRHNLIHTGERPFECDVCDKKFSQKCHLIEHIRIHTGERPFECDVCHKKFSQKCHFIEHKHIHTGERRFECDVCNNKFNRKRDLNRHIRIHTGERPFECDVIKNFIEKDV